MKKDKTEKILGSLSDYLKKRNYECGFNIPQAAAGDTSEREAGMLGLLESQSPNSYSFSASSANHFHVDHQFARLKSWMMEASEPCRSELSQLLFPLFVHIFLELSAAAGKQPANAFFNKNYQVFRVNRDYETTLRQLVNANGETNISLVRCLRRGKYQVRLSDFSILNYLLRYLKSSNNPTIVQILHRYIEIELEDGFVPSNVFSDLENSKSDTSKDDQSSGPDCTAEELSSLESVINSVRQLHHPGLSLALYSVVNAINGVCNAATSPNVDVLACGFEDSVVKLWSLTPHWPHSGRSSSSSVGVNKSHIVLSCDDARLDDPLKEERKSGVGEDSSSDGAGSSSGVRQQKHGGEIWALRGHSGPVYDLAFSNSSDHLLSVSEDTYMRLWNVADGECVAKYSGHNYPVFRVECAPHNVHVATGSYDLSARLWNLEYLHPLRVFAGHSGTVSALDFHPNCSYLATGSWDHSVRLWHVTDASVARILLHHTAPITCLAFAPHGRHLASGGNDGSVVIWDLGSGKVLADITHLTTCDLPLVGANASPADGIVELSWSRDSKLLVVGSLDGVVRTIGLQQIDESSSSSSLSGSSSSASSVSGNGSVGGGSEKTGASSATEKAATLECNEVHSIACGGGTGGESTLVHARLTAHNYITAVVAVLPDIRMDS